MKKFKQRVKNIFAIGASVAMIGATCMGALAMDLTLKSYPEKFKDSIVVVGSLADGKDDISAEDILANLGAKISLGDGIGISSVGDDLNLNEPLFNASRTLDKDDIVLLADGTLTEKDENKDYDYTQEIVLSKIQSIVFDNPDSDIYDKPIINLNQENDEAWIFNLEFRENVDLTEFDDSEIIKIAGKEYAFKQGIDEISDISIFDASSKLVAMKDGPVTVQGIQIEVTGGSSMMGEASIKINGETEIVGGGDEVAVAGTDVTLHIDNVFIDDTVEPKEVSVKIYVGKGEITLEGATIEDCSDTSSFTEIEVNGEKLDGVLSCVSTLTDNTEVESISFMFVPSDMDIDEKEYLELGETIIDPLLGAFGMKFYSLVPEFKDTRDRTKIIIERSSDDYSLSFENKEGDEYEFDVWTTDNANSPYVIWHPKFHGEITNDTIGKKEVFLLTEGNDVTKAYQLINVDSDGITTLEDVSGGRFEVALNKEIEDTGAFILTNDYAEDTITITTGTLTNTIITDFDGKIDISTNLFTFGEDYNNRFIDEIDEVIPVILGVNILNASDNYDIRMSYVSNPYFSEDDESGNINYGLTLYGTYLEMERDSAGDFLKIYYPESEMDFNVEIVPIETADSLTRTFVLDSQINIRDKNVILVGGPCANKATAELLGVTQNYPECTKGFIPGKGILELKENGEGIALIVAGYSKFDTQVSAKALEKELPDKNYATTSGTSLLVSDITIK